MALSKQEQQAMKHRIAWMTLALGSVVFAEQAHAQYNLRTIPTTPTAGMPFQAAFDGNTCETFFLTAPANAPSVTTQGITIRVAVDHLALANCIAQPAT